MGSKLWNPQGFSSTAQQRHKCFSDILIRASGPLAPLVNLTTKPIAREKKMNKAKNLYDITVFLS